MNKLYNSCSHVRNSSVTVHYTVPVVWELTTKIHPCCNTRFSFLSMYELTQITKNHPYYNTRFSLLSMYELTQIGCEFIAYV